MKFAVVLLVVLPLALASPVDKRGALDFLGLSHLGDVFNLGKLKETAQHIVDNLGTDASEAQCETQCHGFLSVEPTHLLHTVCTPLCKSFQTVIHMLHIVPAS
ncbi:uncharacterized protein [Littorina saxatilis]|uniref:Uncharacterized protein n=1 Tax=Littorina saxatilis TaxID=31220 RepID=A0AAN9BKS5_9CAEN